MDYGDAQTFLQIARRGPAVDPHFGEARSRIRLHRRRHVRDLVGDAFEGRAREMRPDGSGGVLVTDGPFTESVEQVVGFYLVESDDRPDLVRICSQFAARGELIELRDMVGDDDHDHGGAS